MPIPVFQTIGLIGKFGDPNVAGALKQIAAHLLQRQLRVLLDESSAELIPDSGLEVASRPESCEIELNLLASTSGRRPGQNKHARS